MAAPKVKTTGIHVEGLYPLLRTLNKMGAEVGDRVKDASIDLAEDFLSMVQPSTVAQRRIMTAFRVYRDKIPKVGFAAGKAAGVSGGAKLGQFFFGHEFGGRQQSTTMQFPPSTREGHFFYPVLHRRGPDLAQEWFDFITDELDDTWTQGARRA